MNSDRAALELCALRALCACPDRSRVHVATHQLGRQEWSDADHQVVFAAIRSALERGAAITPETLIVMATRAGFPDVELGQYFVASENVELEAAVRELLAASPQQ